MFKKLKDKLAEEVKQSPFKSTVQQLANAVVSPSSSSVFEPSSNDHLYTIDDGEDEDNQETPQNSPAKSAGGFTTVNLRGESSSSLVQSPLAQDPSSMAAGQLSRRSSVSSVTSDVSSIFPRFESSATHFHLQSDLESASEVEDLHSVQLERISKEKIYDAYRKLRLRYNKYKGRFVDLAEHYRRLEKENAKCKNVLTETQDKALRRISELREQCTLEQEAKAHLEEALRNDLEERDHLITTLNTKIELLKSSADIEPPLHCENSTDSNDKLNQSSPNADADLLDQNNLLKEKVRKLEGLLAKCKTSITEKNEHMENIQQELDALKDNKVTMMEELELSRSQLDRLRGEMDWMKRAEEEAALTLAENKLGVHRELEARDDLIRTLRATIEEANTHKAELATKVSQLEAEVKAVTEAERERISEEERADLLQELSRGKSEAVKLLQQKLIATEEALTDRLKAKQEEVETLSTENSVLKGKNKELEDRLSSASPTCDSPPESVIIAAKGDKEDYENKIKILQSGKAVLEKKLEELECKIEQGANELFQVRQECDKFKQDYNSALSENNLLKIQVSASKQLSEENDILRRSEESASEMLKRMEESLAAKGGDFSDQKNLYETKINNLESLISGLKKRVKKMNEDIAEKEKVDTEKMEQIEKLEDHLNQLKKETDRLGKENANLEVEINKARAEIGKLHSDLKEEKIKSEEVISSLKIELGRKEGENSETQLELIECRSNVERLNDAVGKLKEEKLKSEEIISSIKIELGRKEEENSELIECHSKVEEMNDTIRRLKEEKLKSEEIISSIKIELGRKEEENSELIEYRSKVEELNDANRKLKEENLKSEQVISSLKIEFDRKEGENSETQLELLECRSKVEQLNNVNIRLKEEMDKQMTQFSNCNLVNSILEGVIMSAKAAVNSGGKGYEENGLKDRLKKVLAEKTADCGICEDAESLLHSIIDLKKSLDEKDGTIGNHLNELKVERALRANILDRLSLELKNVEEIKHVYQNLSSDVREFTSDVKDHIFTIKDQFELLSQMNNKIDSDSTFNNELEDYRGSIERLKLEIKEKDLLIENNTKLITGYEKEVDSLKVEQDLFRQEENAKYVKLKDEMLYNDQLFRDLLGAKERELSSLIDKLVLTDEKVNGLQKDNFEKSALISELEKRLESLERESRKELEIKMKERDLEFDKIRTINEKVSLEIKEREDRIKELEQLYEIELKRLDEEHRKRICELENGASESAFNLNLSKIERDKLQEEVDRLAREVARLSSWNDVEDTGQVDGLKKECDDLKVKLKEMEDEQADKIKQLVLDFNSEISKRDEEIERLESRNIDRSDEELNVTFMDLREQIKDLQAELEERGDAFEGLLTEYNTLKKDMEKRLEDVKKTHEAEIRENDKKWRACHDRRLAELEARHKEEVTELTDEWKAERKYGMKVGDSEKGINTQDEELECSSRLAAVAMETSVTSVELLRQQITALGQQLEQSRAQHLKEVGELQRVLLMKKRPSTTNEKRRQEEEEQDNMEDCTEMEYLRNILFEYMMGKEPLVLAKVLSAIVKFDPDQTNKILQKEEQKVSLLGQLGLS